MNCSEYKRKCKTGYPASIPQIVAHIQAYLAENPIPAGDEIGQIIIQYITEHPEVLDVPVVVGATESEDGEKGLVPQPLAGDEGKVLFGDGTFKTITIPTVDVMEGATASTDGESGLVPQPLAGDEGKVLFGDGTFKDLPDPPEIPVMEGATTSTDGESGLVPQPLAGDEGKVLFGDGTFKRTWDALEISVDALDWQSNHAWPGNTAPQGETASSCYYAEIIEGTGVSTCADGDDFKLSSYNQSVCVADVWVYIGTAAVIVCTTGNTTNALTIKGIVIHK